MLKEIIEHQYNALTDRALKECFAGIRLKECNDEKYKHYKEQDACIKARRKLEAYLTEEEKREIDWRRNQSGKSTII